MIRVLSGRINLLFLVLVTKLCPTLSRSHGLQPVRLLCLRDFPGRNTGVDWPFPSPGDLPDPGIELVYPALAGGFFTTATPGKNKLSKRNPLVLP